MTKTAARRLKLFGSSQLLERGFGHAFLPGRIAQLESVAARIKKIKLSPREITLGPVIEPIDRNFSFRENLARLHESLRSHGKGVMHVVVFFERFVDVRLSFTKEDVVVADVEAGHPGIAESPQVLETEQFAVKCFRLAQAIHRDRPMGDTFNFEQSHKTPS